MLGAGRTIDGELRCRRRLRAGDVASHARVVAGILRRETGQSIDLFLRAGFNIVNYLQSGCRNNQTAITRQQARSRRRRRRRRKGFVKQSQRLSIVQPLNGGGW